jgi:hypothetical protein
MSDLSFRLGRLLNSERGASTADITLVCGADPSVSIAAHRVLLAAASEPLRALIELHGADPRSAVPGTLPRLVIHGISASALSALARFIYTGQTPEDPLCAVEMLCCAEKFALPALRTAMEHLIPRALRDDNACEVMTQAAECVLRFPESASS